MRAAAYNIDCQGIAIQPVAILVLQNAADMQESALSHAVPDHLVKQRPEAHPQAFGRRGAVAIRRLQRCLDGALLGDGDLIPQLAAPYSLLHRGAGRRERFEVAANTRTSTWCDF